MTQSILPKFTKEVITRPIPQGLIKIKPGKGANSYISGSTVIDHLNQAFGYHWSFETVKEWVQESVDKFNPKYDSEPIPQGPVAHVKGRLTVHAQQADGTFVTIVKEQYGSKTVIGGQSDQESIFKAAGTDALKKCASLLGIGLQLYRDEEEQAFFDEMNYEDPWTEETKAQFADALEYIQAFMTANGFTDNEMAYYYEQFSNGAFSTFAWITPDNIEAFIAYLKAELEAAEGAE